MTQKLPRLIEAVSCCHVARPVLHQTQGVRPKKNLHQHHSHAAKMSRVLPRLGASRCYSDSHSRQPLVTKAMDTPTDSKRSTIIGAPRNHVEGVL